MWIGPSGMSEVILGTKPLFAVSGLFNSQVTGTKLVTDHGGNVFSELLWQIHHSLLQQHQSYWQNIPKHKLHLNFNLMVERYSGCNIIFYLCLHPFPFSRSSLKNCVSELCSL